MVKFKIEKGLGLQTVNYIRQLLLTQMQTWRPIAFSIGSSANVVFAGENILEDSVEISTNICKYYYDLQEESDYHVVTLSAKELSISDIESLESITVLNSDGHSILHSLDQPVTITIYFRRASGFKDAKDNQAFLLRHGVGANGIIIMNSRHCNYANIKTDVQPISELQEEVSIEIITEFELDERQQIIDCCTGAVDLFKNVLKTV